MPVSECKSLLNRVATRLQANPWKKSQNAKKEMDMTATETGVRTIREIKTLREVETLREVKTLREFETVREVKILFLFLWRTKA